MIFVQDGKLDVSRTTIDVLINNHKRFQILTEYCKSEKTANAGALNGKNSENWEYHKKMSIEKVVNFLNNGFHIVPIEMDYNLSTTESRRSKSTAVSKGAVLLDIDNLLDVFGDKAPKTINEYLGFLDAEARSWVTWIGESPSSRSQKKPELRLRLMIVFEIDISIKYFSKLVVKLLNTNRFPGATPAADKDPVRVNFGNGRPESRNVFVGGFLPKKKILLVFETIKMEDEREKREKEEKKKRYEEAIKRQKQNGDFSDDDIPWKAFDLDADQYLTSLGYTHLFDSPIYRTYSRPGGIEG